MKKVLIIATFVLLCSESIGQVKITTPAEKQNEEIIFDDSKNWQGENYMSYIGQSLYVIPRSESLVEYGYRDFYESITDGKTYQPISSYSKNTKHEALASKTFKVEDVIISGNDYMGDPNVYLKLSLEDEIVYYKYDLWYEHSFPFVVMGYLDRLQKDYKGKKSVLLKCADTKLTDYMTGKEVLLIPGTIWTCTDIVLDSRYYNLIMLFANDKGETIDNEVFRYKFMFLPLAERNRLESVYGKDLVQTAIHGKIKIGMPKELVVVAWGEPKKINPSSYNEQWVYYDYCVYFKNGKVTGWN